MLSQRLLETFVGLFLLLAMVALVFLAFKVSGLTSLMPVKAYTITANFDDIGGLKIRAPVKIGGVQVGEVDKISLDPITFKSIVKMRIYANNNEIPDDSAAGIYTMGLLGDNYIAITPMYNKSYLKEGSKIQITKSAMVLEKLIGQFIYRMTSNVTERHTEKKAALSLNLKSDNLNERSLKNANY